MLINTVIAVAATQGAGLAYHVGGRSCPACSRGRGWRVPIAAAVIAYHLVQGALAERVVPLVTRRRQSLVADARAGRIARLPARRLRRDGRSST